MQMSTPLQLGSTWADSTSTEISFAGPISLKYSKQLQLFLSCMIWGKNELIKQYICAAYIPLELRTLEIIISKRNSNFSTKTVNYECRIQGMQMPAFMHHCLGRAMTDLVHTASIVSQKHVIRYALEQAPLLILETSLVSQDREGPGSITAAITAAQHILILFFFLLFFSLSTAST